MQIMEKKTYWCQFSYFLHLHGPNLVQILSQDHTHFFLAGFQWNILAKGI